MYTLIHSYNKNINFFSKTGNVLLRSTPTSALRTSLSRLVRVCFANAKKAECLHTTLCFLTKPAMSYFPRQPPAKYLRRWGA